MTLTERVALQFTLDLKAGMKWRMVTDPDAPSATRDWPEDLDEGWKKVEEICDQVFQE